MTNEQIQRLNEIRDWADAFAPKPFVMQQDTMQFLLSLIDEWERVMERLPRTADGVVVTPGMFIWNKHGAFTVAHRITARDGHGAVESDTSAGLFYLDPQQHYSTPQAAQSTQAKEQA